LIGGGMFTPGVFARQALKAIEASEGRTMRRKRDQLADVIGLGIKRGLLARRRQIRRLRASRAGSSTRP